MESRGRTFESSVGKGAKGCPMEMTTWGISTLHFRRRELPDYEFTDCGFPPPRPCPPASLREIPTRAY
jgi:hypothetical protein